MHSLHPLKIMPAVLSVMACGSLVPALATELSAAQAMQILSASAQNKVERASLQRLLQSESAQVIVEYHAPSAQHLLRQLNTPASGTSLQQIKANLATVKQQTEQALPEVQTVRDYDALPMRQLQVKNRRALTALLEHANVKAVHDIRYYQHNTMQSLPLIRQPQAVAAGFGGAGASVAVLDTGVDYARAAFGNCTAPSVPATCRVAAALDTAPGDGQLDAHGHGTNVAGIVATVAPQARILSVDVFNGDSASNADIISGINWVINNRAAYNIVAMNLSLGIRGSRHDSECSGSWATTPFANARSVGILSIVAAGNDGFSNGVEEPACAPGAVRVGAVHDSAYGTYSIGCTDAVTAADKITCFSNSGRLLSVLAPGAMIQAANISMAGTSQAAPHVAGAVAVLRGNGAAPNDTPDQTMNRITQHGVPLTDPRNNLTRPRLDLLAAVNSIPRQNTNPAWLTPVLQLLLED